MDRNAYLPEHLDETRMGRGMQLWVAEYCDAKLGRAHITKTGTTAKVLWSIMESKPEVQGAVQVGKFA